MIRPVRFLKRPKHMASLIVVTIWLFGCDSSSTKATDAGGVDAVLDIATHDDGGPPDSAPADIASDTGTGSDGAADGGDGGGDPCHPPCRARLYNGCAPEGTCTYGLGTACFSNGVIFVSLTPGGPTRQTVSKDGVVCATLDATSVWRDPNGAPLGTLGVNSDGTTTYSCTGEAPQTVPASCTINCKSGMCPP